MTEYNVVWRIDLDAETPEQAAKLARAIQLDPDSTATVFQIRRPGVAWLQEVDSQECQEEEIETLTDEQLASADLKAKVMAFFTAAPDEVNRKLDRLIASGSGVLTAHRKRDLDYLESRKVLIALLQDLLEGSQPPAFMNTKKFKADVNNYYLLL